MDIDKLTKQVNWLDDERRKDQNRLASIEERLNSIESLSQSNAKELKTLGGDVERLNTILNRMDEIEETTRQLRSEMGRLPGEMEKSLDKREAELNKLRQAEFRNLEKELSNMRKEIEQLAEIKRNLQARVEEENRLQREIDEILNQVETTRRSQEEFTRTVRIIEDGRRQDTKRLTDMIGEVAAIRKRVDEHRGKLDLANTEIKKLDNRMNELVSLESERRETLKSYLDNQALKDVERDRMWKEWQTHFSTIEQQANEMEETLQKFESTHKTIKQAQAELQELSEKVERRITELTEMQRLSEERLRQEWVAFKADDQKRWTNYTLTVDEQYNEFERQQERLADQVTNLQDDLHDLQDVLSMANEETEKRLQNLLSMTHEWVSNYERLIGRSK